MKKGVFAVIVVSMFAISVPSYALSNATRSGEDYVFTMDAVRKIETMVSNFGTDEIKFKYGEISAKLRDASELHYGQEFYHSTTQFRKLKSHIIDLLQNLSNEYLMRSKLMLDTTSKQAFDIVVKYNRKSARASFIGKPIDPIREKEMKDKSTDPKKQGKPEDDDDDYLEKTEQVDDLTVKPEEYSYFYEREKIENRLKIGYQKYQKAKKLFEDPEIEFLMKKQTKISDNNIDYIISQYLNVITLCREAKENVVEIHKIMRQHKLSRSLSLYGITQSTIRPVYDLRIPKKYRIDANDNRNMVHSLEIKKLGKQAEEKPEDKTKP